MIDIFLGQAYALHLNGYVLLISLGMTILKCFCFEFVLRIKSHAEQAARKQFAGKENSVSPDESTGKWLCVETQTSYHSSSCIMNH